MVVSNFAPNVRVISSPTRPSHCFVAMGSYIPPYIIGFLRVFVLLSAIINFKKSVQSEDAPAVGLSPESER